MKRQLAIISFISLFAAFVFSSTLIVGGCGGGGDGGGIIIGGGGLATGTFTKTVAPGTGNSFNAPFDDVSNDHEQNLFFASDINGSGYIKSLSFRYMNDESVSTNCPDVTIKMGHTSLSALTTTFANNVEQGRGSLATVFTGSITIPAGVAGDYFTIVLDTPFHYNGVDNLVVEFIKSILCDNSVELATTSAIYTNVTLWDSNEASATGTLFNNYPNAKFNFAGGDNPPFTVGGLIASVPFTSDPNAQRQQQLYLSSDIDGSGPITGVGIEVGALTTEQTYTVSVKLGHATVSTLDTDYDANYSGSPKTVANAVTFTVPAGVPAGSYAWVPLTGSFNYNGTDNLILEFVVSSGTGDTFWAYHDHGSGDVRLIYGPSDASVINSVNIAIHHPKFRFNGGTMDVITDGVGSYIIPVGSFVNEFIVQILNDKTSLGTGGQITSLGFRLSSDAVAFDHTDVNLVLGHTTLSTLGTASLAANIESDRTAAFSGTISIPAGLKAGDWVMVPLARPFTYDPTKNLVVQWDAPVFATTNSSIGSTDPLPQYAGHVEGNLGDRTSDVSNASGDFVLDMSLILNK